MTHPLARICCAWAILVPLCGGACFAAGAPQAAVPNHAIVPGFERFATNPALKPAEAGRLLLGELNCTSCHWSEDQGSEILRRQAPVLDSVGSRVQVEWLRQFVADPQHAKPGTLMPNVLAGLPEAKRAEQLNDVVHFLASTGTLGHLGRQQQRAAEGERLYHQVGCVACHGPRGAAPPNSPTVPVADDDDEDAAPKPAAFAGAVPLGDLSSKYSGPSLIQFLLEPEKTRPSGRMPNWNLSGDDAAALASWLLRDAPDGAPLEPNLGVEYFEGNWQKLPNFDELKPVAAGTTTGFDCSNAPHSNDMALRFSGALRIENSGDYIFILTSDDGSKLWVDGHLAADHDGIHAPSSKAGSPIHLDQGVHDLVVGVFNGGGGMELDVDIQGGGLGRQSLQPWLAISREAASKPTNKNEAKFQIDPAAAARGKTAFTSLGCAACHQPGQQANAPPVAETPASLPSAPPLAKLRAGRGCLADKPSVGVPHFALSQEQRGAIAAALSALTTVTPVATGPAADQQTISRTLLAFNCYACHARGGMGGVQSAADPYFETQQKEMGDEGRLPPPLDGVGGKLNANWIRHVFSDGAKDRPYMLARMPRFGWNHLEKLDVALDTADSVTPPPVVEFGDHEREAKAAGRMIVGDQGGLGCVKCHNFRDISSKGIQAMNLTLMPQRLKHDWFRRYVLNPAEFRPGTRMPAAWPGGKSFLPKVLDGHADTQIEAVWQYLSDGDRAMIPYGLSRSPIELKPVDSAIIYRNFIEGAGWRAIGVGYPEHANLAFDANDLQLALIWRGDFMDASRHWTDRGVGYQPPLGHDVATLGPQKESAYAALDKPDEPWPKTTARELGYRFRGYRLTSDDRPTFLYEVGPLRVEDFPKVTLVGDKPALRREFAFRGSARGSQLFYRAAVGGNIQPLADGWFRVGEKWNTRIVGPVQPTLRSNNTELVLPLDFDGELKFVQEYQW